MSPALVLYISNLWYVSAKSKHSNDALSGWIYIKILSLWANTKIQYISLSVVVAVSGWIYIKISLSYLKHIGLKLFMVAGGWWRSGREEEVRGQMITFGIFHFCISHFCISHFCISHFLVFLYMLNFGGGILRNEHMK